MKRVLNAPNVILFLLCLMYLITYIDRVNISTAAAPIQAEFKLTNTELGLIFSAFAYPYAIFQIIGGFVGDNASYLIGRLVGCRVASRLLSRGSRRSHRRRRNHPSPSRRRSLRRSRRNRLVSMESSKTSNAQPRTLNAQRSGSSHFQRSMFDVGRWAFDVRRNSSGRISREPVSAPRPWSPRG